MFPTFTLAAVAALALPTCGGAPMPQYKHNKTSKTCAHKPGGDDNECDDREDIVSTVNNESTLLPIAYPPTAI